MDFYSECINCEVYKNKKLNFIQKYKIRTFNPALNAVYLLRKYQYHANKSTPPHIFHNTLAKLYYRKLFTKYNIFIRSTTKIGKGLSLPHPTGIIFGEFVEIGENCTVYQHVTFGSARKGDYKLKLQPKVGSNCVFFAGSCILGKITVADNTTVGCNSVLTKSTEEGSTYVGVSKRVK